MFNRRTRHVVGGNQRVALFRQARKTCTVRLVSEPHADDVGTRALGYVEMTDPSTNRKQRYCYREVDWDPIKEGAANIAANSAGGNFDPVKLGALIDRLEGGGFPIGEIPIDTVEVERARRAYEYVRSRTERGLRHRRLSTSQAQAG